MTRAPALALSLVLLPSLAEAYADAPARNDPPPASVRVVGAATVRDARITVRCESTTVFTRSARCAVHASWELVADAELSVTVRPTVTVRFDGDAAPIESLRPAGSHTRVTVDETVSIVASSRLRDGPWIVPPMVARHPLFGDSERLEQRAGDGTRVLVSGPSLTIDATPALDAQGDRVTVGARLADGTGPAGRTLERATPERRIVLAMTLPARSTSVGPMRLGGPVLAGGARFRWDPDERARVVLRAGYEVSLWEYGFVHAAVETDFESVYESLVVDIASPSVLLLIPSFRVGAGVVFRQLGHRDPDMALRLRAGANLFPAGFDVDADWWPTIDAWTLSLTGRLGL